MTLLIQSIWWGIVLGDSHKTKEVPCYDKYSNKIVGQVCIDKGIELNMTVAILFSFLFEVLILVLGYLTYRKEEDNLIDWRI